MGWSGFARSICAVTAGALACGAGAFAAVGECSPNLSVNTPTPTLSWDQIDHANTIGYRVYWKRDEDGAWRGFKDLPSWPGDMNSVAVWPGVTIPIAVQKIVPVTEQQSLIDFMVVAYSSTNKESAPSTILRMCMPAVWTGGPYY